MRLTENSRINHDYKNETTQLVGADRLNKKMQSPRAGTVGLTSRGSGDNVISQQNGARGCRQNGRKSNRGSRRFARGILLAGKVFLHKGQQACRLVSQGSTQDGWKTCPQVSGRIVSPSLKPSMQIAHKERESSGPGATVSLPSSWASGCSGAIPERYARLSPEDSLNGLQACYLRDAL